MTLAELRVRGIELSNILDEAVEKKEFEQVKTSYVHLWLYLLVDPDPNPDFRIGAQYVKNYQNSYHFRETGGTLLRSAGIPNCAKKVCWLSKHVCILSA